MDHDAGRAVGRTTFGDVHVDGHAAAVLGDYNVYNHVALSPEEVEKIARRGTLWTTSVERVPLAYLDRAYHGPGLR